MTDRGLVPMMAENDPFGARSIPETEHLLTVNRRRRWASGTRQFFHRTPNGVNDPITFFHVVQALLNIVPHERFTSKALANTLQHTAPQLTWDPVTIGRVLNDIRETCEEANGQTNFQPLVARRHWDGTHYQVTASPEARAVLINLLDDLVELAEAQVQAEAAGVPPKRLSSPLGACPSLLIPA